MDVLIRMYNRNCMVYHAMFSCPRFILNYEICSPASAVLLIDVQMIVILQLSDRNFFIRFDIFYQS